MSVRVYWPAECVSSLWFASALQSAARETVSAPDFADLEAAALAYGPDSFIAEQVAFFRRLAGK